MTSVFRYILFAVVEVLAMNSEHIRYTNGQSVSVLPYRFESISMCFTTLPFRHIQRKILFVAKFNNAYYIYVENAFPASENIPIDLMHALLVV